MMMMYMNCVCVCSARWCATDMSSFKGPRSAAEGADTPVYLALRPEGRGEAALVTGKLFAERAEILF